MNCVMEFLRPCSSISRRLRHLFAGSRVLSAHVGYEENDAEHDAECSDNDVADGQEIICASQNVRSRQNEVLAAGEWADVIVVLDGELVFALFHVLFNFAVEFAEVGQTSGPHPHNEVF